MSCKQHLRQHIERRDESGKKCHHRACECYDLSSMGVFFGLIVASQKYDAIAIQADQHRDADKNYRIPIPLGKPGLAHVMSVHNTTLSISAPPFRSFPINREGEGTQPARGK